MEIYRVRVIIRMSLILKLWEQRRISRDSAGRKIRKSMTDSDRHTHVRDGRGREVTEESE